MGEYAGTGTLSATNVFGADGLISRRTGGASVFYNYDDRGNAVQSLDGSGNSYYVFEYDVWGNRTQPVGNTPGPWDMGARFGYYTDTETGLSLLTHRFYSPSVGRFLTRDPLGYRGGINLYGYCQNDPINSIDPEGYLPFKPPTVPGHGDGFGDKFRRWLCATFKIGCPPPIFPTGPPPPWRMACPDGSGKMPVKVRPPTMGNSPYGPDPNWPSPDSGGRTGPSIPPDWLPPAGPDPTMSPTTTTTVGVVVIVVIIVVLAPVGA